MIGMGNDTSVGTLGTGLAISSTGCGSLGILGVILFGVDTLGTVGSMLFAVVGAVSLAMLSEVRLLNMLASCWSASSCCWPSVANGPAGAGCKSACVSWAAACMAASVLEVLSIFWLAGMNSTVSVMHVCAVFVTNTLKHL